jgi:hypothetical protein
MISFEKIPEIGARAIVKTILNTTRGFNLIDYEGRHVFQPNLWQGYKEKAFPRVICEVTSFSSSEFDLFNSVFSKCSALINEFDPDEFILVVLKEISQNGRKNLYERFKEHKRIKLTLYTLTELDSIVNSVPGLKYAFKEFQSEDQKIEINGNLVGANYRDLLRKSLENGTIGLIDIRLFLSSMFVLENVSTSQRKKLSEDLKLIEREYIKLTQEEKKIAILLIDGFLRGAILGKEKIASQETKRRYWAGGFGKGDEFYDRLEDFTKNNYWQALDYDDYSNQKVAANAWALFREIQIGDWFIIKGYGGGSVMGVHYAGEVKEKNEDTGRLDFKNLGINPFKIEPPKGPGAGNWFNTLLEIKRLEDMDKLFIQPIHISSNEKPSTSDFSSKDFSDDFNVGQPEIISNNFSFANFSHDQAIGSQDLLGFEKDVRSFASIMALKEVKPPLAIALFGNWGTGKSFFMNSLQKDINYLSKYQSFPGMMAKEGQKIFCDGILQIQFNAWSYLDANLWAGLVANIFEKIDEYISEQTKGDAERQKVREILNEKLEIISTSKKAIKKSANSLINKKQEVALQIEALEERQGQLINDIEGQTWEDLSKEILNKIKLEPVIQNELDAYGITKDKQKELSPDAIYAEFRSWNSFVKNLLKLSTLGRVLLIISLSILVFVLINPNNICDQIFETCSRWIIAFISIAGPIFSALYASYSKFKKLLHPITKLKDDFNQKMAEAKFNYEKKLGLLSAQERQIEKELKIRVRELEVLDEQIEEVTYELKHSVTKRAFTNFVKAKAKDEKYEKHLGIISTIRRDFETLSELFIENGTEKNSIEVSEEKEKERNKVYEKLKEQFDKPLNRIILYIDDLDRCSEEKVLEVLQAVHLIMAFPLFIVVVGVDKRCVNNALNYKNLSQYRGLKIETGKSLSESGIEPIEPNEYLEKIFQIPFHLQETSEESINNMIDSLLTGQVEIEDLEIKDGDFTAESLDQELPLNDIKEMHLKAEKELEKIRSQANLKNNESSQENHVVLMENLTITSTEFKYLKEISFMVSKTPRTVKRFLNLYRIVRAHEGLSYSKENKNEEFKIIMFLLAFCNGPYSSLCKEFVAQIRTAEIIEADPIDETLEGLLESKLKDNPFDKNCNQLFDKMNGSSFKPLLSMPPERFLNYLSFIQRFSFN